MLSFSSEFDHGFLVFLASFSFVCFLPSCLLLSIAPTVGGGLDGGVCGAAGRVGGDFGAVQMWGDGRGSLFPHRRRQQDYDRRE